MSDKIFLKDITLPIIETGEDQTYSFVQTDADLDTAGDAADAKKTGDEITQLKADLTDIETALGTKAEIDGSYEDLTAGNAKQLESTQYVEDSEPYLFRTSGGSSDIGNREYVDAIVGGSVVWNQLCNPSGGESSFEANGITKTKNGDGSYTFNGTSTAYFAHVMFGLGKTVFNHVVLAKFNQNTPQSGVSGMIQCNGSGAEKRVSSTVSDYVMCKCVPTNSTGYRISVYFDNTTTVENITVKPVAFDLTAMFGSTIADYIYSLELATAGAGVAWFRKLFPKDYYEYDAGTIKSVEGLTAHKMVGFNAIDPELATQASTNNVHIKPISVIPGQTYQLTSDELNCAKYIYDYDTGTQISVVYGSTTSQTVTVPNSTRRISINYYHPNGITIATVMGSNPCLHLVWSGTHNGEYQPYEKHSYPLDDSLTLRGIPKLDANNDLYYDGDTYEADGTVTRRYLIDDMGTWNWQYVTNDGDPYFAAYPVGKKSGLNILCSAYPAASTTGTASLANKQVGASGTGVGVFIRDDTYTDAATFKAAMSGKYIIYELATPITETADPYQEVQICNDWGTEEYVIDSEIDVPIPVGHETRYPANLRDKLQHLPDLADNDGYYAIKQVGTQMSLEPFRIPKAPETDGTYTLKATVASGTPTYTWESEVTEG